MSITQALSAVMADVQAVAKKDRNTHSNYNFRGVDAVVNAVGPALRTHDVVVVPTLDHVEYADVQTSTGKAANACRVQVTYTFWHGESSLSTSVAAEAWDSGDKAAPKAMSVAFRTALLQALCLPTDEPDPDSHTYERAAKPKSRTAVLRIRQKAKGLDPDGLAMVRKYLADHDASALDDLDGEQLADVAHLVDAALADVDNANVPVGDQ